MQMAVGPGREDERLVSVSTTQSETRTLVVRFDIAGDLCYLSHHETAAMFQRALVRAGIPVVFSQGFNPHPRMSLALPRSVGVEAQDDILTVQVAAALDADAGSLATHLAAELPAECRVRGAELVAGRVTYHAERAEYVICVKPAAGGGVLEERLASLQAAVAQGQRVIVRRGDGQGRAGREKDVGPFIESVNVRGAEVVFGCRITSEGTIRVEEMLELVGLAAENLAVPVRRESVQWACD